MEISRAADERRVDGQLAEEQRFHSQLMTAVYVGLALVAVLLVSRLFKRSPRLLHSISSSSTTPYQRKHELVDSTACIPP